MDQSLGFPLRQAQPEIQPLVSHDPPIRNDMEGTHELGDSETTVAIRDHDVSTVEDAGLWTEAYNRLKASKPDLLTTFETLLQDGGSDDDRNLGERLSNAVTRRKNEMMDKRWTLRFMNHKVKIRESVQRIAKILQILNSFGGIAMQVDPYHAGLPVAAVNVLLTLVLNDSQQNDAALNGLEEVSLIVARYSSMQETCMGAEKEKIILELKEMLTSLYMKILEFQATAACHFGRRKFLRTVRSSLQLDDWMKLLIQIRLKDTECLRITRMLDSQFHRSEHKKLLETMKQQEIMIKSLSEHLRFDQQENVQILRWFSDVQYRSDHDEVRRMLGKRYQNSCQWLLSRIANKEAPVTWLCGMVGSGKSCAISAVIHHKMPSVTTVLDQRVAHFYVSQKRPRRTEPVDVFRCLLTQLACCEDGISVAEPLRAIYEERGRDRVSGGGEVTLEESIELLIKMMTPGTKTTIIIDGLDESSDASVLLSSLEEVRNGAGTRIDMFLSSRMHIDVPQHFPDCEKIQIEEGNDSGDMEAYIRGEVLHQNRRLLDGKRPDLEERLIQVLLARAQGMFIWVKLQLVMFFSPKARLRFSTDVEKKLEALASDPTLPETNNLYEEIININTRPGSKDREYAMRAMQWVLLALEDFTIGELAKAVSIDNDGHFDDELDGAMLLEICSNLILVDKDGFCRLAHLSLKGYLLRSGEHDNAGGLYSTAQVHAQITERCLCFLVNKSADFDGDGSVFALSGEAFFKKYALYNWAHHCTSETLNLPTSEPLKSMINMIGSQDLIMKVDAYGGTVLHKCAVAGNVELASLLLVRMRSEDIAIRDIHGSTALYLACVHDQVEILRLILEHMRPEDIFLQHRGGKTPLLVAFDSTSPASFELLLLKASSQTLNIQDIGGKTIFHVVCQSGNERRLIQFLQHDFDMEVRDSDGVTGLLLAVLQRASVDFVQLLLDHGANVGAVDNKGYTALHFAVIERNYTLAKLLIDARANVNVATATGWAPLQHALMGRNLDTKLLRLLIESGADVNARTSTGLTALHVAADLMPDNEALCLLIDKCQMVRMQADSMQRV